jgi:hypothetical protein
LNREAHSRPELCRLLYIVLLKVIPIAVLHA